MRAILTLGLCLLVSGCVVTKPQLRDPYAVARIDSPKTVQDFADCVANALKTEVRSARGSTHVIVSNDLGVQVARWDFIGTNAGSQAELRASEKYDAGTDAVIACA